MENEFYSAKIFEISSKAIINVNTCRFKSLLFLLVAMDRNLDYESCHIRTYMKTTTFSLLPSEANDLKLHVMRKVLQEL